MIIWHVRSKSEGMHLTQNLVFEVLHALNCCLFCNTREMKTHFQQLNGNVIATPKRKFNKEMTKNVHTSLVVAFLSFLRIIWVSLAFFLACLTERSIWNPAFSDVSFGSCSSSSAIFLDNNWQDFFVIDLRIFFLKD